MHFQKLQCTFFAAFLLTSVQATTGHEPKLKGLIPNDNEDAAIAKGERLGVGTARLIGPERVEAYTYHTWRFVYEAGKAGIAGGGAIRIGMRHLPCWTMPQTTDPSGDGYLTARTSPAQQLQIRCQPTKDLTGQYFAWQQLVEITLPNKGLGPGEKLEIVYGDRTHGSAGIRVQPFDESCFVFKTYVDVLGEGTYLPLRKSPAIEIMSGPAHRLSIVMPSDATVGQPTWCLLRAEDRFGNPATSYRGTVRLHCDGGHAATSGYLCVFDL